jgi:hypothetical protein
MDDISATITGTLLHSWLEEVSTMLLFWGSAVKPSLEAIGHHVEVNHDKTNISETMLVNFTILYKIYGKLLPVLDTFQTAWLEEHWSKAPNRNSMMERNPWMYTKGKTAQKILDGLFSPWPCQCLIIVTAVKMQILWLSELSWTCIIM